MTQQLQRTAQPIQDAFLNRLRKEHMPVSIHTTNGYQFNGACICAFDNFSILITIGDRQHLIYKHAISTITPDKPVNIGVGEGD